MGQPFAKNEAVQGAKNQPFGAPGGSRYDTNVLRLQSVFTDVDQRLGTCVDVEGLHGFKCMGANGEGGSLYMWERRPRRE